MSREQHAPHGNLDRILAGEPLAEDWRLGLCPRCRARPGQPCTTGAQVHPLSGPHPERCAPPAETRREVMMGLFGRRHDRGDVTGQLFDQIQDQEFDLEQGANPHEFEDEDDENDWYED